MNRNDFLKLGAVLVLAGLLLSLNLTKKFIGHHDWNSAMYSTIARNYDRYGVLGTKGGQVENPDIVKNGGFSFKTHYPPLLPLLMSLSFHLFGVFEFSARLVPYFASLFMIVFIYLVAKRLYGQDVAFLASVLLVVTPLFLYFGTSPVHETIVPVFSLMAFWGYLQFFNRPSLFSFCILLFGVVLGGLTNWTGFYIVPPIILHYILFKKSLVARLGIGALIPLCVGLFVLHVLHVRWLTGGTGGLAGIFLDRLNPYRTSDLTGFTLKGYLLQELLYLRVYFTKIISVTAGIWLLGLCFRRLTHRVTLADSFVIILFLYGITHLIFFQNLVYIHDYMIYYLIPFMGMAAASVIMTGYHWLPKRLAGPFLLLVVLVVSTERLAFTKALFASDMNVKGVAIGDFIRWHTVSGEIAFVGSSAYNQFYNVFINYYSGRLVEYGEEMPKSFDRYRLVVRPKAHDALSDGAKKYLDASFSRQENEAYIWYDLQP